MSKSAQSKEEKSLLKSDSWEEESVENKKESSNKFLIDSWKESNALPNCPPEEVIISVDQVRSSSNSRWCQKCSLSGTPFWVPEWLGFISTGWFNNFWLQEWMRKVWFQLSFLTPKQQVYHPTRVAKCV